jgi:hypothetical protein
MRQLDLLKVVLVLVALAIWAYGLRTNNVVLTYVAIVFVLVALLLRFVGRRPRGGPRA